MEVVCTGTVVSTEVQFRRRRSMICTIEDNSGGVLCLRFFHFNKQQREKLTQGTRVRCFGEIRRGPTALEIVHPEYDTIGAGSVPIVAESLTPIYPVTEGLHQLSMRKITTGALELLDKTKLAELLPSSTELFEDAGDFSITLSDALHTCLLYTSPSPRDGLLSRMPSSA